MLFGFMLSSLFACCLFFWIVHLMNYPYGGSDHCYHYKLINFIKNNQGKMIRKFENPYQYFSVYPQFYHYICSFLSNEFLLKKANIINYLIMIMIIFTFNVFLFTIFDEYIIIQDTFLPVLIGNILFITMPVAYVIWNAKFTGLSARALGIFFAYLYIYLLFFYLNHQTSAWIFLLAIVCLAWLSSQFASQYFLFSIIFVSLLTSSYELLLLVPLSVVLLFVFNFDMTKNFFIAQYHHKRNYKKFMIEGYQFKMRYSIWRDFIYDFWIKKDKTYFLGNPVIEIVVGALPNCLVFLSFIWLGDWDSELQVNLYILLSSTFFAFFVTSLRCGRFLGEPQRYIEFGIPITAILCILIFPIWINIILVIFNFYILIWYSKHSQYHREKAEYVNIRAELLSYMQEIYNDEYRQLISNDQELIRYFYTTQYDPYVPNFCVYYKDNDDFFATYYKGDYNRVSPAYVIQKMQACSKGYLILYTNLEKFYDETALEAHLGHIQLSYEKTIGKFKIFKFYPKAN